MWNELERKYVMCGKINIASYNITGKFVEIEFEFPHIFVYMKKCAICGLVLDFQQKVFSGGIVFICFNDLPFEGFEATQVCLRFFDS